MYRSDIEKKRFVFLVCVLLVLSIGIGYAVLSQKLNINSFVNYGSMKWDVGFTSAVDGDGSITSIPYISTDKKVITVTCDLGKSTSAETCIVNATITNGSTFDIMLKDFPTLTYDNTYINSVDLIWMDSLSALTKYNFVGMGKSKDLQIKVNTKELSVEMLPEEPLSITITILIDWVEADSNVNSIVYDVGHEISIGRDKFNVISDNGDTVTMLAKYSLNADYRQSDNEKNVQFSNSNGWEYTPGPKEIDFQNYEGSAKTYVNKYVSYLQNKTDDSSITGTLITMNQLKSLDCVINDDYTYTEYLYCYYSDYKSWLLNGTAWWTRSAYATSDYAVWEVEESGLLFGAPHYGYNASIRPVITISKSTLRSVEINGVEEEKIVQYAVGDEITIANEKFNVISDNGNTVTMFSKYGIDDTYRQSASATNGRFSNTYGWPFRPGPLEIDFQTYDGTAKTKVNEYVNYLQTETGDTTLTGTLMTMTELKPLGCTISDDYSYIADLTCANSEHADWLLNGQTWWTRSAFYQGNMIWLVKDTGLISMGNGSSNAATIRPVITISKSAISS